MLEDLILFIDGEAIVLDKPAGLPVDAPRAGGDSIERRIDELRCGFKRPPVAMHRLDQDTSGCLLFARHASARVVFQQAFEAGTVEKTYLAVLAGEVAEEGVIDLPLGKVSSAEAGWKMRPDPAGKSAITHWRRLAMRDGRSLVEFRPKTGRTHQIRAHAREGSAPGSSAISSMACPAARCCFTPSAWSSRAARSHRSTSLRRCPGRSPNGATTLRSMKPDDVRIPDDALSEKFLAATGPGGQNVNKVATACQLRCNVFALGLSPQAYAQLKTIAGSKLTSGGELIITARRYRTQEGNREDARARLAKIIADARIVQAKRRATRPSRAAKARRVETKKGRGEVKKGRGKVSLD